MKNSVHPLDGSPRRRSPYVIGLSAGLLCVSGFSVAIAESGVTTGLDEVLVTATKRETKLLQTPISMTVLSADALETNHVDDFGDYERMIPGLTALDVGPGQKRYALRGLQSAGEPEVALYYDEIPISGLPGASLDTGDSQPDIKLWDVDRVEVLRGPQGTLYGNGSMGGAIRILSKRPVLDRLQGEVEASGALTDGGADSWRVNAMVNTPIVEDRLALRLSVYVRSEGGWIDDNYRSDIALPQVVGNDLNWEHTWGGRASMMFSPDDAWTVTATAYYQSLRTGDSFETYPSFASPADPYESKAFVRTPWTDQSEMFNLVSTYHLGWADFVATGSYQKRNATINLDSTRFLLSFSHCTEFTWQKSCFGPDDVPADSSAYEGVTASSGELRLVSQTHGALEWTVGVFIQDAGTFRRGQLAVTNSAGYIVYDPTTGDARNRLFARTNHDVFDQYASFGESTYALTERLKATVGLRWFHSYRSDQQDLVQQFFPGAPTGPEPFQSFSESSLFRKFQISYAFNPDVFFYTEAAQGFRAGGPNYPGGFALTATPYAADSVWDYEVGWKLALADHRVNWTGALYRLNWSNVQQLLPVQLFSAIVNGGAARSDGFETEVEAKVSQEWSISAGASFSNAHLIGPQPKASNPTLQLVEGDRLGGVPKWTTNVALNYVRPLGSQWEGRAQLGYTYQSSRGNIVAEQNPSYFVIKGGGLTDLHLSAEKSNDWRLGLHVTNLFDRFVPLAGRTEDANLIKTITPARPRTVSLSIDKQF